MQMQPMVDFTFWTQESDGVERREYDGGKY